MKIQFYQVDAFTREVFGGNPAAVCLLESWLDREMLQAIAAENNVSETAFLVAKGFGLYELRWFSPTIEIDLCGHATLASASVVFEFFETALSSVDFETASGRLTVSKSGDRLLMDFPARPPVQTASPPNLASALGGEPLAVLKSRDLLAVFPDEDSIREMNPDFEKLRQMKDFFAVIVSAPGKTVDFVSRFFAPNAGILEDPVTGSAHCTLIPYWAARLNKNRLHALQLSPRVGELFCEHAGDRVQISGHAVLFAKGELYL
ncbi:MAG: PhzF family phenazine biosynthesis protein [Proteobacteria bacterium]|nr:PhzF family phenazine biosynthesis protein [Pseudomonadota bacterium]MBU1686131.1 PhzF family phenazine biosynthesis protein [Pseudomonadota bacterium]